MATASTDLDRSWWTENETAINPEPSFEKKKRDNVSLYIFILNCGFFANYAIKAN